MQHYIVHMPGCSAVSFCSDCALWSLPLLYLVSLWTELRLPFPSRYHLSLWSDQRGTGAQSLPRGDCERNWRFRLPDSPGRGCSWQREFKNLTFRPGCTHPSLSAAIEVTHSNTGHKYLETPAASGHWARRGPCPLGVYRFCHSSARVPCLGDQRNTVCLLASKWIVFWLRSRGVISNNRFSLHEVFTQVLEGSLCSLKFIHMSAWHRVSAQ